MLVVMAPSSQYVCDHFHSGHSRCSYQSSITVSTSARAAAACCCCCCRSTSQVLHGAANDVLFLQRDFHLYLVNVFDTEKACQVRLCWALDLMAWSTRNVELMT